MIGLLTVPFFTSVAHAQYVGRGSYGPQAQYHSPSFFQGGGAPVVVPPTVITTQGYEHNSSKKSCKESVIDLFLFSVRRTTGDCTP